MKLFVHAASHFDGVPLMISGGTHSETKDTSSRLSRWGHTRPPHKDRRPGEFPPIHQADYPVIVGGAA